MELAYFNTNHPDFVGGNHVVSIQSQGHHTSHYHNRDSNSSFNNSFPSYPHPPSSASEAPLYTRQLQRQQQQSNEQQILQEAAIAVAGATANHQQQQRAGGIAPQQLPNGAPTVPHSSQLPTNGTGSTTTTPEQSASAFTTATIPTDSTSLSLPISTYSQQPSGGFLSFFKSSKTSSVPPQPTPASALLGPQTNSSASSQLAATNGILPSSYEVCSSRECSYYRIWFHLLS